MNWYRVRLNGQNFLLNLEGDARKFGFYTTRDVKAESFEDAEMKAVESVKNDETLTNNSLNDRTDSPMIFVDEMRMLQNDEKHLKNMGFSFYGEENEIA